jgi:hypothetical protein
VRLTIPSNLGVIADLRTMFDSGVEVDKDQDWTRRLIPLLFVPGLEPVRHETDSPYLMEGLLFPHSS